MINAQENTKLVETNLAKSKELYEKKIVALLSKFGNKTKIAIVSLLKVDSEINSEVINSAIESLKSSGRIKYSKSKPQGYYITEDIEAKKEKIIKQPIITKPTIESEESLEDIKTKFIRVMEEKGIIKLKSELKDYIISSGFTEIEFSSIFDQLKSENIVVYSKSSPRGYSISKNKIELDTKIILEENYKPTSNIEERLEIEKNSSEKDLILVDFDNSKKKFIDLLVENSPISSKQKLLDFMENNGLGKDISEQIMDHLKKDGGLIYSRKKPQGYSIEMK